MKYLVSYYEDEYTIIHEIEIECDKEEIKEIVDKYYEENLKQFDIAGAKWRKVYD